MKNLSYKLHSYWRSSSSWRVRIGLEVKGLSYDYLSVHLLRGGGEQHAPDYQSLNRMEQVPLLEWTEAGQKRAMSQSLAILALLDAHQPEPRLYPEDPVHRARVLELAEVINSGIQPVQNLSVLQAVTALGGDRLAWGAEANRRGLAMVEALASGYSSEYLAGDQLSVADLCLIPQLYNARRFKVDLSPFRRLLEIEARCAALPAFQRAHPEVQPDANSPA